MRDRHHLLTLGFHHACLEHGAVLFAEERDDVLVGVEGLALDHEGHVGEVGVVQQAGDALEEPRLRLGLEVPLGARVRVQLVHVLQVVLSVAAPDDVKFGAYEGHRVSRPHLRVLLRIREAVTMCPGCTLRVECVQIVKALGVWA